ncbi:tetratricopeptide repeat protein [Ochrovirga pacifica]|uniref:tetratricopeptide repeat protein n=1 Tax=Ochrovirga pacifica TaxID=1042376 RepID=UPI0002559DA2|nr:tetratricopeptide repeat protein [Ochrovirga pacifica]
MKKAPIIFFLFSLIFTSGFSQNMKQGFTYLETGKYALAETFFEKTLKEYPNNKTAKLCYGRAVGLNGNANKAVGIFTEMLATYPNDFEIELNYAESLLWSKQYNKAESYYQTLVAKDSKSFAALLGYANTLSNLKKYNDALNYVNKALEVLPGNPNALVSKKYMYLGLANEQAQNQNYQEAIATLKKDLLLFPNDKDILLNLANIYIIAKEYNQAESLYVAMKKDSSLYFTAKNSLSLVAHLKEKDKKALKISDETLKELTENTNEKDTKQTQERYAQALIWNGQYRKAKEYIHKIEYGKENENWILGLKATLYTYTGDFANSLDLYNQILKNDIASFDGNLGKANALKANNKIKLALSAAETTLEHFPNQKDALNFIKQVKINYLPTLHTRVSHSFDNGESKNNTYQLALNLPVSIKTEIIASLEQKDAKNDVTDNESTSETINLGLSYQLFPKVNLSGTLGVNRVEGTAKGIKNEYEQTTALIQFKTTPFKRQLLDFGYKRETQNFNAELLNQEIVQNNLFLNYNLNTTFRLGWFTQYFYTFQNDSNKRNLLFTSLYYNFVKKPAIKGGINFQYLTFKNQVPTVYFSPSSFKAVELFINLIKDKAIAKDNQLFYGLTAAYGYQYTEQNPKTSSYRVQSNLGYKFNDFCYLEAYHTISSIAPIAAVDSSNGFEYNELGLKFLWKFTEKPLFRSLQ